MQTYNTRAPVCYTSNVRYTCRCPGHVAAPLPRIGSITFRNTHATPTEKATACHAATGSCRSQSKCASLTGEDLNNLLQSAHLADSSAGLTRPHPNAACVLVSSEGKALASAHQQAWDSTPPEIQAVAAARGACRGATAYLNLEPGQAELRHLTANQSDHASDGDSRSSAVEALAEAGVARVVVGMRHPWRRLRGKSIAALRARGVAVDVLGEAALAGEPDQESVARAAVLAANEALLHHVACKQPFSIFKYAMTLDGKIATPQGHSAWITSPPARSLVFDARARSDAVIVGGNTVRRDDPKLTTRRDTGHMPARVVVSRGMDLPGQAALWDVRVAPTLVLTQRGTRPELQARLRDQGVEVVEFDNLTPAAVANHCYARGFMQLFWECGGALGAPCISAGIIHRIMAFVAPKIIGGAGAPTPVGELGFTRMTQALELAETRWQQVGPDLLITGYLPSSGGLVALDRKLSSGLDS